ncbi:MAG: response regulator transcription factor [Bacteroidales bacterium]|nr:response regulator transcription factor [Bacteroidales bacterium]MBN2819388.1 response regulator transcription factor [Bacteroidales bacterium]
MKQKILLVEDDENLGFVTKDFLEMSGFSVSLATNGKTGLEAYQDGNYDIIILDVMMPQVDGFSVAQTIRKNDKSTPIIFLTAKNMKEDRIRGFKLGGDDYITKPFSTEELTLRIEAILRRMNNGADQDQVIYKIGPFSFNYSEHSLNSEKGGSQRLTKREAEVLRMLCEYKNKILRRDVALKAIWGDDDYFMGRSMDVYITKLRKMLKTEDGITINNIHNTGFKLEVAE